MTLFSRYVSVARGAQLTAPDSNRSIPVYDPRGVLDRINRSLRRRLSDRVEDMFHVACLSNDLDVAEKLLGLLEYMHERRIVKFGGQQRIDDTAVEKAREELARRKAMVRPS